MNFREIEALITVIFWLIAEHFLLVTYFIFQISKEHPSNQNGVVFEYPVGGLSCYSSSKQNHALSIQYQIPHIASLMRQDLRLSVICIEFTRMRVLTMKQNTFVLGCMEMPLNRRWLCSITHSSPGRPDHSWMIGEFSERKKIQTTDQSLCCSTGHSFP